MKNELSVQEKPNAALIDSDRILKEVLKLARSCSYEKEHSHQVTKLALRLFDELKPLHHLGEQSRRLLQSASLLHDIGWVKGRVRHHKTSRDIILKSFDLPLTPAERLVVALVARYHRKALPKETHKYYCDLNHKDRDEINKLAALLRVADGLDREHVSSVRDLSCQIMPKHVKIQIMGDKFSEWEKSVALEKADLFQLVFQKELMINDRLSKNWLGV